MPDNRREHDRSACSILVTMEHGGRSWSGFASNISEGGAYIVSYVPAIVGDEIKLWLDRPQDGRTVSLEGEVRHMTSSRSSNSRGVGIQFSDLLAHAPAI